MHDRKERPKVRRLEAKIVTPIREVELTELGERQTVRSGCSGRGEVERNRGTISSTLFPFHSPTENGRIVSLSPDPF